MVWLGLGLGLGLRFGLGSGLGLPCWRRVSKSLGSEPDFFFFLSFLSFLFFFDFLSFLFLTMVVVWWW